MQRKIIILLTLLTLVSTINYAQVTIGSGEVPNKGALLDLKEEGKTTKGLGLPRVELKDYDKLIIGDKDYSAKASDHTGLIVYHIMSVDDVCKSMPSGLYVWDGGKWLALSSRKKSIRPSYEYPMTNKTDLAQPNSYIADKTGVIKIPIAKAIAVWDGQSWKGDTQAGKAALSAVLPTTKNIPTMNLEAKLVWTDDQCVSNLILNVDDLKIEGTGDDRYIEVWVGDEKGNAVIALIEKGKDPKDEALWSWHIWATDQPSQTSYNNNVWLDRNLGATSTTVADAKSIGLHYQWGRKDPLPSSKDWSDADNTIIYGTDGSEINYNASSYIVDANTGFADDKARLTYTINRPLSFITNSLEPDDWYTTTTNSLWHNRWGADGTKSPSDPCPEGWRIPIGSGGVFAYPWNHNTSPWNTLTKENGTWDKGFNWTTAPNNVGYYPASGYHSVSEGSVGAIGYYWSGSPYDKYARALHFHSGNVTWNGVGRANGISVRCARELGSDGCPLPGDRPTDLPVISTQKQGLDQPNSYIVSQESLVKIPIAKAKAVWDGSSWKGDTEANVNMNPVLLSANSTFPTGKLDAKAVWKDVKCGLIKEVNLSADGQFIEVWVGNEKGNAVIALVEEGKDPEQEALWSWHIWATDQPSQTDYNGNLWLDRNLGATSATVPEKETIGLYYQWGRKDPFPASQDWGLVSKTVYGSDGFEIDYTASTYKLDVNTGFTGSTELDKQASRLTHTINRPLSFITSDSAPYDWYTITSNSLWHNRWGASGVKSPSDPCPEGWRVPNGSGASAYPWNHNTSPWNTLTKDNGSFHNGWSWTIPPAGYYPAAAHRFYSDGLVKISGMNGFYWSASPDDSSNARILHSTSNKTVNPWEPFARAYGFSVRCVEERGPDDCPLPGDRPTNLLVISTSKQGLDQPNSYIVSQESLVKIPIDKARKVWDGQSWKGDTQTNASLNPVLLSANSTFPIGKLEAKAVWKDVKCGLIKEVKLSTDGQFIEIWVGSEKGNAVIALVEEGKNPEKEALWSWHIWASDEPSQTSYNNNVWLDRNLGATSATVADAKSIGLHYQWGRKDPFPTSTDWNNTSTTKVYNTNGKEIVYDASYYMANANTNFASDQARLTYAINRPLSFIKSDLDPNDWYTTTLGSLWHNRWAADGAKSPSDPCPEGWRVPNGTGATTYPWNHVTSPWSTLTKANSNGGSFLKGYNWATAPNNAGYYSAAGCRYFIDGSLRYISGDSNYWSAAPDSNLAHALGFNESYVYPWPNGLRAYGLSVRCVQE